MRNFNKGFESLCKFRPSSSFQQSYSQFSWKANSRHVYLLELRLMMVNYCFNSIIGYPASWKLWQWNSVGFHVIPHFKVSEQLLFQPNFDRH